MRIPTILIVLSFFLTTGVFADADGPKVSTATDFFASDNVWTFHLRISAEDWTTMQPPPRRGGFGPGGGGPPGGPPRQDQARPRPNDQPPQPDDRPRPGNDRQQPGGPPRQPGQFAPGKFGFEYKFVKGSLEFQGQTYAEVGVRFKGNSSYQMSAQSLKRPFKIDFNHYVEGQKFFGLTTVDLSNNMNDTSQLRETLAYSIFHDAGVPAARTAFVKLYLTVPGKYDNQYLGLYTLVEQVNKPFLKDHFKKSAKGMLLKPERVKDLPYLGEDWDRYKAQYRPKTDASEAQQRRLIEFTKLINQADDARFRREIDSYLDVDEFLRFVAVNAIVSNMDSFLGTGHNYYLYLPKDDGQFTFIPWDLNEAFGGFMMAGSADMQMDLSLDHPYTGRIRLIERLFAMDGIRQKYREQIKKLSETTFRRENMEAKIDKLTALIREAIEAEPKNDRRGGRDGFGPPRGMDRQRPDLKAFVARRAESISRQLAGESKGHEPENNRPGGFGRPGFGPPGRPDRPGGG